MDIDIYNPTDPINAHIPIPATIPVSPNKSIQPQQSNMSRQYTRPKSKQIKSSQTHFSRSANQSHQATNELLGEWVDTGAGR